MTDKNKKDDRSARKKEAEEIFEEILEGLEEREESVPLTPEESLEARIIALEEELAKSGEAVLRVHAEYENYRKRTTKEKSSIYPVATAQVVAQFLPILDNFERAMEFDSETKEFKEGLVLIQQSLAEIMANLGVEPIGERGEPFNPELHSAVMRCEDDELPENSIAQVLQKGYKIGDRVLRHAMVQTAN